MHEQLGFLVFIQAPHPHPGPIPGQRTRLWLQTTAHGSHQDHWYWTPGFQGKAGLPRLLSGDFWVSFSLHERVTCSHSLLCFLSKTHRFRLRSAQWRSPIFGFSLSPLPLSHYAKLHPQHVPAFINVASKVLGAIAHLPPPPANHSLLHPHFIPRPHCLLMYSSLSKPHNHCLSLFFFPVISFLEKQDFFFT